MDKKICAFIFTITFILISGLVHSNSENIQRSPPVNQFIEVEIEDPTHAGLIKEGGFDFTLEQNKNMPNHARIPANIVSKSEPNSPFMYIGPILFLIALPIGLWIMVSKKFSKNTGEDLNQDKVGFKKTSDDNDDDYTDYPKAS